MCTSAGKKPFRKTDLSRAVATRFSVTDRQLAAYLACGGAFGGLWREAVESGCRVASNNLSTLNESCTLISQERFLPRLERL